jgi:hypothetical protein
VRPEEALAAARSAAADRDDELPAGMAIEPTERVSIEQLMEWAAIEPDVELMVSTRRLGAPITWLKRKLIHFMRQYLRELQSQQTRFNLNVLIRVAELEDRVARLEEGAAGRAPASGEAATRYGAPEAQVARAYGAPEAEAEAETQAEVAREHGAPGAQAEVARAVQPAEPEG